MKKNPGKKASKADKTAHPGETADHKAKEPLPSDDEKKPFDFGGLPDRDLKKNLGCG